MPKRRPTKTKADELDRKPVAESRGIQFLPAAARRRWSIASSTASRGAACSAGCGFVHYDNPTPVVAAVVEHEGQVVLARNRAWPRTFYGLITGFLEREESPEQCVVREVKEELNLDAAAPTLIGVYAFERMNQVIIAYHVHGHRHDRAQRRARRLQARAVRALPGVARRHGLRAARLAADEGYEPEMIELSTAAASG